MEMFCQMIVDSFVREIQAIERSPDTPEIIRARLRRAIQAYLAARAEETLRASRLDRLDRLDQTR